MLFSKDVLFIHVQRTGGTSICKFLFRVLPGPIYYIFPTPLRGRVDPGIIWVPGNAHENLAETREVVRRYGRDLDQFRLILATVRNPYELEVSRYGTFNRGFGPLNDPNVRLAFEEDFQVFACQNTVYSGIRALQNYYLLDGRVPPNLRIMRFETLQEDLRKALSGIGIESGLEFPHENESSHSGFERYYTETSEQAIYLRHKWVFDLGWYERLHPNHSASEIVKQELQDLKQALREQSEKQKRLIENSYANDRWMQQLETAIHNLEGTARWAHELEAIAREQQATIRAYQRLLGPVLPLARLARSLKERVTRRKGTCVLQ